MFSPNMSEFKFACPVCGQHIKTDSSQAGKVMDCPTCFQKITVPQAPTSQEQKFILTGTHAGEKRPKTLAETAAGKPLTSGKAFPVATFLLILVLSVSAGVYFFGGRMVQLFSNWQPTDIGAVGAPGTFSQNGETLSIGGDGGDIWNQADGFNYVHRPVNGDVSLTVRVVDIQHTDPWAKAGVMVRESLAPEAAYVTMVVTANNGVAFQLRSSTGVPATSGQIIPHLHTPYWVRLRRQGNAFTAESSADGTNWTSAGTTTIDMKPDAYAGLAVCSHKYGTLCLATFDHVSLTGNGAQKKPAESTTSASLAPEKPAPLAPPANDTNWMLVLSTNAIPDAPVSGRIHGQDFLMERAAFQNGSLTLRAGTHGPTEFGVVINFSGAPAEELSGKIINVTTNAEKAAKVSLRWKDDTGTVQKPNFDASYALRLQFGVLANNRLPGKIYLCLPDAEKSYVVGSFIGSVSKPKPKTQ